MLVSYLLLSSSSCPAASIHLVRLGMNSPLCAPPGAGSVAVDSKCASASPEHQRPIVLPSIQERCGRKQASKQQPHGVEVESALRCHAAQLHVDQVQESGGYLPIRDQPLPERQGTMAACLMSTRHEQQQPPAAQRPGF